MPVVQEAFDVPVSIATKILTGEYKRIGGVVRHAIGPNKGQIVKHLKPVDLKVAEQAQGIGAKAIQLAKNNKKAIIVVGIGAGIAAAGVGIYHKVKNSEPKVVVEFKSAFNEYLNAIRAASLNENVIDKLMTALNELKNHKDYEKIQIQLTAEDLDTIVNRIFEYTQKLAEDNNVKLTDSENTRPVKTDNSILALERYLTLQKCIFEEAA